MKKKSGRKYKLRRFYPIGGGYLSSVWNNTIQANIVPRFDQLLSALFSYYFMQLFF